MGGDELTGQKVVLYDPHMLMIDGRTKGVFAAISQRQRQGFTRSQGWLSQRFHCSLPPPQTRFP